MSESSQNNTKNGKLLPCPFCGGEAKRAISNDGAWSVICPNCNTGIFRPRYETNEWDAYKTEAEAIAAWNSRADYHGYEQAAIEAWESIKKWNTRAERTCKPLGTIRYDYEGGYAGTEYETELSCGHKWRDGYGDYPDYCPSCGAKVVGE